MAPMARCASRLRAAGLLGAAWRAAGCGASPIAAAAGAAFPGAARALSTAATTLEQSASPQAATQLRDEDTWDVAIVGGGMVGAAVAALLGANRLTSNLRVAVLDVRPQPFSFAPRPAPDMRVSTVTPSSIAVLQRAGAWEEVEAGSAAFSDMQVWDTASSGHISWDAREAGAERMGVVAENTLLQASLLAAAQRSGRRTAFMWPCEVSALRLPDAAGQPPASAAAAAGAGASEGAAGGGDGGAASTSGGGHGLAELALADGRVLACRLVVAADGAASRVRQLAGLRTWGWSYGQRGLVATVATEEPSHTAWQRFLPTGPLALLPVRGGYSNIVWSTTPAAAAALERMDPRDFAAAVNQALRAPPTTAAASPSSFSFAAALTAALPPAPPLLRGAPLRQPPLVVEWVGSAPRSFPLQAKQSGRYVLPRLALVGDAAHAVHPMAGQGVNLGFGDASALAEAVARAVACGGDVGDAWALGDAYEAPRRAAALAMCATLDGLKRAFEVQSAPFAALRGLGLGVINSVGPLRNGIMSYAMGNRLL